MHEVILGRGNSRRAEDTREIADSRSAAEGTVITRWSLPHATPGDKVTRMSPIARALAPALTLTVGLVALLPGVLAQEARRTRPVPDIPGYVTLKADFHLHSIFSDGEVWPTVHVREALRDGLDAISLTEHLEYRPHKADVAGGAWRAFEVARPVADRLGILLVPGVEITRPVPGVKSDWPVGSAHFNVLFPDRRRRPGHAGSRRGAVAREGAGRVRLLEPSRVHGQTGRVVPARRRAV